jgi:DNA mismatch repair ATPase MutS
MLFKKKKKKTERLLSSFGQMKNDSFDFERIEKYFRNKDNSDSFQILSDKACNDLDFQELFMFIDRTNSKIGQQFLYNKLRVIPSDSKNTLLFEELIEKLTRDDIFRVNIQQQLEKLNNNETYFISSLFQDEHLQPPKWFFIIKLLSFTSLLSLIMLFFNQQMFFVLLGVFIVNIGIHYWNKRNLYQYLGSIPQLLRLNHIASRLFKDDNLKKINLNLQESMNTINKVRNRMSFFKLEANLQGDLEAVFWGVLELFKILFLIEPLLLFGVLRQLETKRKEIEDIFIFIGQIDSIISVASLRKGVESFCIPEINENKKEIIAKEVYHPLINECVHNNIIIAEKSILLTGSNMSGKTSFIRTIGINVITGLTINTCFAKYISIPRIRVFSAIRISDDLMNDKSYYFEEVLTIKEMIENSINSRPNLFLLDEIFKGTNTIERISAGKAVLSSLSDNGNIVLVSTHDIELADLLREKYELYHFSEIVNGKNVDFDYKLKDGKLKNRNAIRILQINNYPEKIIKEAIELSKELDKITVANTQYKKLGRKW